jgi:transcription factor IIIB subunit 2
MNNFRRSVREVVYVVKVADLTIQKRLDEFKNTKSGDLTVEEFRNIWLEQAHDPPSYGPKPTAKRKRVREVNDDGEVVDDLASSEDSHIHDRQRMPDVDDSDNEVVDGLPSSDPPATKRPRLDADGFTIPDLPPIDPELLAASPGTAQDDHNSAIAEEVIESEISNLLSDSQSAAIVEELREAHQKELDSLPKTAVSDDPDDLADVDDDIEVQSALLTEEESNLKEKIWVEFNKDYLRDQESSLLSLPSPFLLPYIRYTKANNAITTVKRLKRETDIRNGTIKSTKRKKKNKPRDSNSENMASTPAESAKQMLQRRSYSKKINYKAIEGLFEDD